MVLEIERKDWLLSVDNSLSKKLSFCRKIDYGVNERKKERMNIWYSQLEATSIQLQVFPPQRKMYKCVYIRGTKSQPTNGFLVHDMNKKKSRSATRSSIWNNDALPQLWKQLVTTLICKKVYEGDCSNCQGIPLLPATYEGWNFNSGNYLFTTDTK